MKISEKKNLRNEAIELKGRRRNRFISDVEIEEMASLDRKKNLAGKVIRVYSNDGFVANSYFGNPVVDYIERIFVDGKKQFSIGQCGAKRAYGSASLITVNSRAY